MCFSIFECLLFALYLSHSVCCHQDANARTRVHEYGGGDYTIHPSGGVVYSDFKTQRLFWNNRDGVKIALTPDTPDGQFRYADGHVDPSGKYLVCVRENHGPKGDATPQDVVNEVVAVSLDGSGKSTVLATGRDFYQSPRLNPSGTQLAYIAWDHPSMPWDTTELRLVDLKNTGSTLAPADPNTSTHALVDGADGETSIIQPAWHPGTGEKINDETFLSL